MMKAFCESLKRCREHSTKPRIALFRPVKSVNDTLYESITELLGQAYFVEVVNTFFLYSYEAMYRETFEILMVVESELLTPQDCNRIREHLRRGGALILGGSNMLMQELDDPEKQKSYFGDADIHAEEESLKKYQQSLARLGVKPYVSDVTPCKVKLDGDFLENGAGWQDMSLTGESAKMNTSSCVDNPQPYAGTCYVERYEVQRNFEVAVGYDAFGRKVTTAVDFAQNSETGARVCLFASNGKGSFLDKDNPYFGDMIRSAAKFCLNKTMLTLCESSYACYRDGETPAVEYRIKSFDDSEMDVRAVVQILDGEKIIRAKELCHRVEPGKETVGHYVWDAAVLDRDYYDICVRLYHGDRLISKAENAFVVWKEEVVRGGSEIFCDGEYFRKNGKKAVLLGTNYYSSQSGGAMWVFPNIAELNADLRDMADFGIECVRVHYHHPKWFHDFYMQKYGRVPERYRVLGDSWLPDEKHMRIMDAHVYLCQKYRMIHSYDLFTLLPVEMGDPRGWGGVHDYICLEDKIACQKKFLDRIIPRYKGVPGISWDVYNEPHHTGLTEDTYYRFVEPVSEWIKMMRDYIAGLGETHPITAGGFVDNVLDKYAKAPGDIVDYFTFHSFWQNAAKLKTPGFAGPQMYHEVWMNRPFTPEGEQAQKCDMRYALISAFRTGMAGFMPWQWTEQLATWQADGTYYGESWDDMLGCCVHNNGTMKPAGRFYRDFIRLFADLTVDGMEEKNRLRTEDGLVTFSDPADVNVGGYYMAYERSGSVVRGIARGRVSEEGFSLATDNDGCDVFFAISDDGSFYCKADDACHFTAAFNKSIRRAVLVGGDRETELPVTGNILETDLALWQTYYWIKVLF